MVIFNSYVSHYQRIGEKSRAMPSRSQDRGRGPQDCGVQTRRSADGLPCVQQAASGRSVGLIQVFDQCLNDWASNRLVFCWSICLTNQFAHNMLCDLSGRWPSKANGIATDWFATLILMRCVFAGRFTGFIILNQQLVFMILLTSGLHPAQWRILSNSVLKHSKRCSLHTVYRHDKLSDWLLFFQPNWGAPKVDGEKYSRKSLDAGKGQGYPVEF